MLVRVILLVLIFRARPPVLSTTVHPTPTIKGPCIPILFLSYFKYLPQFNPTSKTMSNYLTRAERFKQYLNIEANLIFLTLFLWTKRHSFYWFTHSSTIYYFQYTGVPLKINQLWEYIFQHNLLQYYLLSLRGPVKLSITIFHRRRRGEISNLSTVLTGVWPKASLTTIYRIKVVPRLVVKLFS